MRILGLIPARGGSSGVPGKNIKLLGPYPLLAHTIEAARASGCLDRILVSTDAEDIAAVAKAFGAEVPWLRAPRLATHTSAVVDAVLDVLKRLSREGYRPDAVMLLQPTSPFRSAETIRRAVALFNETGGKAVISVAPPKYSPFWFYQVDKKRKLKALLPLKDRALLRQELPASYVLDGSIFLSKTEALLKTRSFHPADSVAVISPAEEALDIDTPEDWEQAEWLWAARAKKARGARTGTLMIIAEAGVNHNGDLSLARKLVDAAAQAGADAVKFQTFQAEKIVTRRASKAPYQIKATGGGETQFELLKKLELSREAFTALARHCREKGILFLSSPFDEESADFLESLGMTMFKVASGELTNQSLLAHIARKGKPILLSTGMSTLAEVAAAVRCVKENGNPPLTLLHCVSNYPADAADANLKAMATMSEAFALPVGYSDHTEGIAVAVAAAALGACVIEKHFTLDKNLPGPDQKMSLNPEELKSLVAAARQARAALGSGLKEPRPSEASTLLAARRSVVLAQDVPAGTKLTDKLLTVKRPGTGIPPSQLSALIGRSLRRGASRDTVLQWEMLA